ncbi:MAG: PSP1 C-terminal domain-containing protein [Planctomycetota bacterium]
MHLVRVGVHGQIGRFRTPDGARHPRAARVVVRTARGLEIGEVLGQSQGGQSQGHSAGSEADGELLRAMTPQDELLAQRLANRAGEAYQACASLLEERGVAAVLTDTELLFDGRGLYFHFLGDPPPEAEQLTAELAEAYEATAEIGRFAQTLEEGCGPGCGTEEAKGQGSCDSCVSCALADACKT